MVTQDLNGNTFQLTFQRPAQMLLFAGVSCDPPLGQSTVIPYDQNEVKFTVAVESSVSFSNQPWEAVIWHNCHSDGHWDGITLKEDDSFTQPVSHYRKGPIAIDVDRHKARR